MTATSTALPTLQNFRTCNACGERIAWVMVNPGHQRRPVNPEPRPLAEYLLLRDGRTAVNLRDPLVDEQFEAYAGPRFWDHRKTCPVPSMRTARAALGALLDPDAREEDPFTALREGQRRALLRAERERHR